MANDHDKNGKPQDSKPQDALQDLEAQGDPTGGKAGQDKKEYLTVKLENVLISGFSS